MAGSIGYPHGSWPLPLGCESLGLLGYVQSIYIVNVTRLYTDGFFFFFIRRVSDTSDVWRL